MGAPSPTQRAIDAVWRIEAAKIIAGAARLVRDVGLAEELAQDALVAALEHWPVDGVPDNPGAWLMATAKNRALDRLRQAALHARKHEQIGADLEALQAHVVPDFVDALAAAKVPFEVPAAEARAPRLASVLEVIYLVFNEGYAATAGDDWMRPTLCDEALRLGRVLAGLVPNEPEVHGLVALMEIHASRTHARTDAQGRPVLLLDQDRSRWDRLLIRRGLTALARAGGARGPYALQAAIAACHTRAGTPDATDWPHIVAHHWLPSVRGDLLAKLGRHGEARHEFERAAALTRNARERAFLLERARQQGAGSNGTA